MCQFSVLILVFASALALPSKYIEKNDYRFELSVPRDLITAANAPAKNEKPSKNAVGKTDEAGYYKTFGSDAEGEKGYEKGTFSHGENGYKELDTFHKQIGDQYGFEEHLEFGKEKEEEAATKHAAINHKSGDEDAEGAGTSVDTYYAGSGEASSASGEYSGGGGHYHSGGSGGNYNEEYSSGGGGEGEYSRSTSYSRNSKDGDKSSGEHHY